MHLLAYDLIRSLMGGSGRVVRKAPRQISFKGTLQALTAFQEPLKRASPEGRRVLVEVMLETIAYHEMGDRPGRVEPRAIKRRPKPHDMLMEFRRQARKRLLANA